MILFYYQELMCPKNCHLSTDPYHVAMEGTWFLEGGAAAGGTWDTLTRRCSRKLRGISNLRADFSANVCGLPLTRRSL